MDTGDPSPGIERLEQEVSHSSPRNTEVKKELTLLNKNRLHENTEASEILLLLTLMYHVYTFKTNSSSSYHHYYGTTTRLQNLLPIHTTYSHEFLLVAHKIEQLLTTQRSRWWSPPHYHVPPQTFNTCTQTAQQRDMANARDI